jgi:hypothetical protein
MNLAGYIHGTTVAYYSTSLGSTSYVLKSPIVHVLLY